MQCRRCQQENPPQAKFCRGCGMRLSPRCAQCGIELTAQDRFRMECGTPVDGPTAPPPQRRQRTLDACKRLLLRESQVQPLLLIFEDLHWIDAETQALLDSLVESLPTAPVLLLVNYRPEYEHLWNRKTYYQQLRLDPLPPENATELLAALLGDAAELQSLTRVLIARTEGNPLFVEESVRTLVESGVLVGERGCYRLVRPFESTQVPATVQAVLAARTDRLPPEDKRLLQAAAVIGKDVPYPLLQAIAELPEDTLRQGLGRLQAAEFLYETALFPDLEYTFKHALTHEVAYGSLLHERRCAVHGQIVEAIETLYPDRLAEHVERLAHHAVRGAVWEQAIPYLRQAGAKAASRSAHRDAVGYLEQAADAVAQLPESRAMRELAVDVRLDLRNSHLSLGELSRLNEHLRVAQKLAEELGDERRVVWVSAHMLVCLWIAGEHQRVVELGERIFETGSALQDLGMQAHARVRLTQALYSLGDYRQAISWARGNLTSLEGPLARESFGMPGPPAVICMNYLARASAELGEFAEGAAVEQAAIQLAEETEQPFTRITAAQHEGYLRLREGNLPQAIRLLEGSLRLADSLNIAHLRLRIAADLGYAYVLDGRIGAGLLLLEQAMQEAVAQRTAGDQSGWLTYLAEGHLLAGRLGDAGGLGERALALAREHHESGQEAWALRLLGEITAHADPPDVEQGESHYQQAIARAEELGMRPLVAHCHLGLGTLYHKVGRGGESQAELKTAAEMYRAMEMTFWLARAETELGQIAPAP